jgi:hypothetical protein
MIYASADSIHLGSFISLPLRLAILSSPVAVWGMLYFASRISRISPVRFLPWLKAGYFVLAGTSLVLFLFNRTSIADVAFIHAWGLMAAQLWICRHFKVDTLQPQQNLTFLNLSMPPSENLHPQATR